jgi:mannosyltransferase OCH1-like enzyme
MQRQEDQEFKVILSTWGIPGQPWLQEILSQTNKQTNMQAKPSVLFRDKNATDRSTFINHSVDGQWTARDCSTQWQVGKGRLDLLKDVSQRQ